MVVPLGVVLIVTAVDPTVPLTPVNAACTPVSTPNTAPVAGIGPELIEEFTVTCGFAINAGDTNWPVATVTPAP